MPQLRLEACHFIYVYTLPVLVTRNYYRGAFVAECNEKIECFCVGCHIFLHEFNTVVIEPCFNSYAWSAFGL